MWFSAEESRAKKCRTTLLFVGKENPQQLTSTTSGEKTMAASPPRGPRTNPCLQNPPPPAPEPVVYFSTAQ